LGAQDRRQAVPPLRRFIRPDAENVPALDLTIDAGSLDTGNGTRDRHPRSERFFDVAALQAATTVDQRELELIFSPASRGRIRACGMRLTTTKDLFSVLTGGAGNADHCARL
jgi:YceI-like domain